MMQDKHDRENNIIVNCNKSEKTLLAGGFITPDSSEQQTAVPSSKMMSLSTNER